MEELELIKKIISDIPTEKIKKKEVTYRFQVPEKIYKKIKEKEGNKIAIKVTACCYEFLYDQETKEKCIYTIAEYLIGPESRNEKRECIITISKNLHSKMKKAAHELKITTSSLYESMIFIVANDLVKFKLPKCRFIRFNLI